VNSRIKHRFTKLCFFLISIILLTPCFGEIEKEIFIQTIPEGASIAKLYSGRSKHIGISPISIKEKFHSEKSIIKLKISACGYKDSIVKINPSMDSLKVRLVKKEVLVIPESEKDILKTHEENEIVNLVDTFLKQFCNKNLDSPLNYMDFVFYNCTPGEIYLRFMFEADSKHIVIKRKNRDSLLINTWNSWFANAVDSFQPSLTLAKDRLSFVFSILVRKKSIKVMYTPGVDVEDKWKTEITTVQTDTGVTTFTRHYLETETERRFTSSLFQAKKSYEMIYKLGYNRKNKKHFKEHTLDGKALVQYQNGKVNSLYDTGSDIVKLSIFKTISSRKKQEK